MFGERNPGTGIDTVQNISGNHKNVIRSVSKFLRVYTSDLENVDGVILNNNDANTLDSFLFTEMRWKTITWKLGLITG